MSKLNDLKKSASVISNALGFVKMLKQSSLSKISISKKRCSFLKKILSYCSILANYAPLPKKKIKEIVLFSDNGLCGDFNSCENIKGERWGKKGSGLPLSQLLEHCEKNWSNLFLEVWVNDSGWKKITMEKSKIDSKGILYETDKNFFSLWQKYFLLYCMSLSMVNENGLRYQFAAKAENNCSDLSKEISTLISKTRKAEINEEIISKINYE